MISDSVAGEAARRHALEPLAEFTLARRLAREWDIRSLLRHRTREQNLRPHDGERAKMSGTLWRSSATMKTCRLRLERTCGRSS